MLTFEEFTKRTLKAKTKGKQERQAPASQSADQVNPSKTAATPDANGDGDPIVMGVIEGIGPSGKR